MRKSSFDHQRYHNGLNISFLFVQSRVKTFLPGFGNGWLKYCAIMKYFGWQRNVLRVITIFLHNSVIVIIQ